MDRLRTLTLAAALAALPLALAHPDGVSGIPKTYCEETLLERQVHEYAGQYPHTPLTLDGSAPGSCPYDPLWDHHPEFGVGGAHLMACESDCWPVAVTTGSLVCLGMSADHASHPTVWVRDVALPSGVRFTVAADTTMGLPAHDVPYCGDGELDTFVSCVDVCAVPFPPGFDGSYVVLVEGVAGHVQTVDPATYPPAWP